jgi:hypothetical protein
MPAGATTSEEDPAGVDWEAEAGYSQEEWEANQNWLKEQWGEDEGKHDFEWQ